MSSKLEAKRAEIALLEAEEEFAAKKAAGTLTNEDKLALRAQRQEYREKYRRPTSEGAAPDAINVKVNS